MQKVFSGKMSATAGKNTNSMKSDTSGKPTKKEQSLFEEDDEFEEFPTEGMAIASWLHWNYPSA